MTDDNIITVCLKENVILNDFASGAMKGIYEFKNPFCAPTAVPYCDGLPSLFTADCG